MRRSASRLWALAGLMVTVLLCLTIAPTRALAVSSEPDISEAQCAIVVDSAGNVLWSKNADQEMSMASITKVMTAVVALESGIDLDSTCTISDVDLGSDSQTAGFTSSDTPTLRQLLQAMLVYSGNDAALALTECAGGVAPFVERMNEKAAALGMRNSHFANPNGLDDEAHYSTAYDMALLGCAAVNEPTLRRMVSTRTAVIGGRTLTNHNKLLSRLDGCVGLKTGYTKAAGRTLVSCAEKDGRRLVAVTLRDGDDWNDHEALYRWGFLLTGIQETLETRLLGALGNGREVSP